LIRKNTFYCRYGVFKVRVSFGHPREEPPQMAVSQNSTAWTSRSTYSRRAQ